MVGELDTSMFIGWTVRNTLTWHWTVGYSCVENDLYIDHWTEEHDKNDQLIDTYQGKLKMKNVKELKYLGFIISEDGSYMNNIEAMGKKAIGIIK